jgi:hypothetical protein
VAWTQVQCHSIANSDTSCSDRPTDLLCSGVIFTVLSANLNSQLTFMAITFSNHGHSARLELSVLQNFIHSTLRDLEHILLGVTSSLPAFWYSGASEPKRILHYTHCRIDMRPLAATMAPVASAVQPRFALHDSAPQTLRCPTATAIRSYTSVEPNNGPEIAASAGNAA